MDFHCPWRAERLRTTTKSEGGNMTRYQWRSVQVFYRVTFYAITISDQSPDGTVTSPVEAVRMVMMAENREESQDR